MVKKMERLKKLSIVTFVLLIALVSPALAVTSDQNAASIEEIKTTLTFMWLLLASGLVFFMHAGFFARGNGAYEK